MQKPYEIINQGTTAQLTVFGEISPWENSSRSFKSEIDALLQAGVKNVSGYINSGGGDVFEAEEIKNQIQRFPGERSCLLGFLCGSAATMIMMGFQKEKVTISPNGFLMYHQLSGGAYGTTSDLQKCIDLMNKLTDNYVQNLIEWSGKTEEYIRNMLNKETWFNATEAKEEGFVGDIAQTKDVNDSVFASLKKGLFKNAPKAVASLFETKTEIIQNQNQSTMLIEAKNKMLGILTLPSNASDEQITAAVKQAIDKAEQADARVLAAKKEANKVVAKMIVDSAETDKKITADEKAQYLIDAEENPELVARIFAKMPTPIKASANQGKQESQEDANRANWTFKDYQDKDLKALELMKEKELSKYEALYKAHYKREA